MLRVLHHDFEDAEIQELDFSSSYIFSMPCTRHAIHAGVSVMLLCSDLLYSIHPCIGSVDML